MKVILKKTNEVKEVSFGYAVNYLIPQGLAEGATPEKLLKLQAREKELQAEKEKQTAEDQLVAQRLAGKEVIIKAKTGKDRKLFGSVTKKEILKALKLKHDNLEILLNASLKELGSHQVDIKVGSVRTTITVKIIKS